MREAMIAFLGGLSRLNAAKEPLTNLLAALPPGLCDGLINDTAEACYALVARLQGLAESGVALRVHRSHGDLAPWNCAWTNQGLFVFDWEASRAQDTALGDAFYYTIAPALLVQRKTKTQQTLTATLWLARQVAVAGEIAEVEVEVYLSLWLLSRLGQAALYGDLLISLERSWL